RKLSNFLYNVCAVRILPEGDEAHRPNPHCNWQPAIAGDRSAQEVKKRTTPHFHAVAAKKKHCIKKGERHDTQPLYPCRDGHCRA
ncbi:MAG: hypothetical protein IJC15_09915, partial [Clostridia bacterium]|nr:hypothetical protein [Clostridia bacterium]